MAVWLYGFMGFSSEQEQKSGTGDWVDYTVMTTRAPVVLKMGKKVENVG